MTQEEKAKAYDEAVNKLRRFMTQGVDPLITRADVQDFFPELAESEDERIRKEFCKDIWTFIPNERAHKYIAWLEKQCKSDETKAKIFLINKGYPIDANGRFPTYEEMYNIIREGFEKKELKKIEQKSAWSEEDEHRVKDIIYFLDTAKKHYESTVEFDACIDWLKSIKQKIGGVK